MTKTCIKVEKLDQRNENYFLKQSTKSGNLTSEEEGGDNEMEKIFNRNVTIIENSESKEMIEKRRVTSYNSERVMVTKVPTTVSERERAQGNLKAHHNLPSDVVAEKPELEEHT